MRNQGSRSALAVLSGFVVLWLACAEPGLAATGDVFRILPSDPTCVIEFRFEGRVVDESTHVGIAGATVTCDPEITIVDSWDPIHTCDLCLWVCPFVTDSSGWYGGTYLVPIMSDMSHCCCIQLPCPMVTMHAYAEGYEEHTCAIVCPTRGFPQRGKTDSTLLIEIDCNFRLRKTGNSIGSQTWSLIKALYR